MKKFLLVLLFLSGPLLTASAQYSHSRPHSHSRPPLAKPSRPAGSAVHPKPQPSSVTHSPLSGNFKGHDYVNLGLPSGTLWATCNIGATNPEEYGDYFAWGETKPKHDYNWTNYFDTNDNGESFIKYNSDGGTIDLAYSDDAAYMNWGSGWRMPNLDQLKELYNNDYTTSVWTFQKGTRGLLITSKSNGVSIFLPAAGWREYDSLHLAGECGEYWSLSLDTGHSNIAWKFSFYSIGIDTEYAIRYHALPVRPVRQ